MFRHAPGRGFNAPPRQRPIRPPMLEAGPEAGVVICGFDVPQELPANGEMDESERSVNDGVTATTITVQEDNEDGEERRDSALPLVGRGKDSALPPLEEVAEFSRSKEDDHETSIPATAVDQTQEHNVERLRSQPSSPAVSPLTIQPTDDFHLFPYRQCDNVRLFPFKEQQVVPPAVKNVPPPQSRAISRQIDMRLQLETMFPRYRNPSYVPFQTPKPVNAPVCTVGPSGPLYARGARIVRPCQWQREDMVVEYIGERGTTEIKRRAVKADLDPQATWPDPPKPYTGEREDSQDSRPTENATYAPTGTSEVTNRPTDQTITTTNDNDNDDNNDDSVSPTSGPSTSLCDSLHTNIPSSAHPPSSSTGSDITIRPPPPLVLPHSPPAPTPSPTPLQTLGSLVGSLVGSLLSLPLHLYRHLYRHLITKLHTYLAARAACRGSLSTHDTHVARALHPSGPSFFDDSPSVSGNAFERHGYDAEGGLVLGNPDVARFRARLEGVGPARGYGTFCVGGGGGGEVDWEERERVAVHAYEAALGGRGRVIADGDGSGRG